MKSDSFGVVLQMSPGTAVAAQEGLRKGEVRLEQVAGDIHLVVDSKDSHQDLMLALASMTT